MMFLKQMTVTPLPRAARGVGIGRLLFFGGRHGATERKIQYSKQQE